MWLRALAGAYAGQIRDYRTDVGLQALHSGTAERVTSTESPLHALSVRAADQMAQAAVIVSADKKRKARK